MLEVDKLEKYSATAGHAYVSGHEINFDEPLVLKKGFRNYRERALTEAMLIHFHQNSMNRNDGTEHLTIIQDQVLPLIFYLMNSSLVIR